MEEPQPVTPQMIDEVRAFDSGDEWRAWRDTRALSADDAQAAVARIRCNGVKSSFLGSVPPESIEIRSDNWRESIRARGLNSRQRAVLELMAAEPQIGVEGKAKIFAPEAITRFALLLRSRFPYFLGSEFTENEEEAARLYPIPSEDLQRLSLQSNTFDAVVSNDVLEHVPSISACLREMARVLKPGGVMISSHPFTWRQGHRVKASMGNGAIVYHEAPEYHGNPVKPEAGSLVFTVPGWAILGDCRAAGFATVEMVMVASERLGIFGSPDTPFVNVLRAYKA